MEKEITQIHLINYKPHLIEGVKSCIASALHFSIDLHLHEEILDAWDNGKEILEIVEALKEETLKKKDLRLEKIKLNVLDVLSK